jgi:hypothetical protein
MEAAMDYDEHKFAELLLYAADRLADDPAGGAVKLNKVLFFAEFAHMRRHGHPITGAEYQKLKWGPAPWRLLPLRQRLLDGGTARMHDETYQGFVQERLVPLREPDLSLFTPDELAAVDQVVGELYGMSATDASLMSHDEVGWQMVEERETIPYEAAFLRRSVRTDTVRRHGAHLAETRRA